MLWALLFKKVPDAKLVYDAELDARADGHLTARIYDAPPGETYHQWSKAWLLELAAEMQPAFQSRLDPGASVTILLADEVAALRFAGGEAPRLIPAGGLKDFERYDLVTTINALKAVWRDGLAYRELLALDLATGASQSGTTPPRPDPRIQVIKGAERKPGGLSDDLFVQKTDFEIKNARCGTGRRHL